MHPSEPESEPTGVFRALAALALTTVVAGLGTSIANVALPAAARHFDVPSSQVQWSTLAYLLAVTLLIVPIGKIADAVGRVRVLLGGIALFSVAAAVAGLAPSLTVLIVGRAFQGVGGAAMSALTVALVRQSVPPGKVGRAMGTMGSSMAAGMALGPAFGGFLVTQFGWRAVFFVMAALGVVSGLGVLADLARFRQPGLARGRVRLDWIGLALLAVGAGSYAMALTGPVSTTARLALLVLAAVVAVVFVVVERRLADPLVDVHELVQLKVLPEFGLALLGSLIMMVFTVVPPFFLVEGLGLADSQMGLVMAIAPLLGMVAGVPAGGLVDRFGSRRITAAGLSLMTLASVLLGTLPAVLGVAGFVMGAVLLTPGNQLFMAANNTSVMRRAPGAHQGRVAGMLNLARNLGSVGGTALGSMLYDSAVAGADGTGAALVDAAFSGQQWAFAASAAAGAVALSIWGSGCGAGKCRRPSVVRRAILAATRHRRDPHAHRLHSDIYLL